MSDRKFLVIFTITLLPCYLQTVRMSPVNRAADLGSVHMVAEVFTVVLMEQRSRVDYQCRKTGSGLSAIEFPW